MGRTKLRRGIGLGVAVLFVAACGGVTPEAEDAAGIDGDDDDGVGRSSDIGGPRAVGPRRGGGGPQVRAEVGALDRAAVDEVTTKVRRDAAVCFERANATLAFPVVHGDIELTVRVGAEGRATVVFPSRDALGHDGVTRCISELLREASWPAPEGGEEGIARATYGRDAEGRAPVPWGEDDLGTAGAALAGALEGCKREHGAGSLSVTLYVDADGAVMAAGAAVDDGDASEAVRCAVSATRGRRYPSPGSFPAKVTLTR
ncbi:MAG: hypothetical protein AAGN82_01045 [Myxococcota bacterium]